MNPERRRFLTQLGLPVVWGLVGCDAERSPKSSNIPEPPTEGSSKPLVLALFPFGTPSRIVNRFQPLAARLSEEIHRPVKLHLAVSYENQVHLLVSGGADLAFMGPAAYIRAYDRYALPDGRRVQLLAGDAPYRGAIVVRKESPIRQLADIKGHTCKAAWFGFCAL
jgi:phosphonate transport system substrate-binding protein